MDYVLNKLNNINGKNIILLLDNYLEKNKRPGLFEILGIDNNGFYVNNESLENIRKKDQQTPCFGIWQLLYTTGQINLSANEQLLVAYNTDNNGIYLYYNRDGGEYKNGLIINNNFLGLFGYDDFKKTVVDINYKLLVSDLSNEILRPIDKYKKNRAITRKISLYLIISSAIIFTSLLLLIDIAYPYMRDNYLAYNNITHKELLTKDADLKRKKIQLTKLQKTHIMSHTDYSMPNILPGLIKLASVNAEIKLEISLHNKDITMEFDNLAPWMSQLSDDFKISKNNNKIKITWSSNDK